MRDVRQYQRERRARLRAAGACTECGEPAGGKWLCAACVEHRRCQRIDRMMRDGGAQADRNLQGMRELRATRLAAGLCTQCARPASGYRCAGCNERARDARKEREMRKEGESDAHRA